MYDYPPSAYHATIPLPLAGIIKVVPRSEVAIPYADLVCSEEDKAHIIEIVTGVAENSWGSLLFNEAHFKKLGVQVNHVHPLKLLSLAVSTPQLKAYMATIFNDYFKRNGFMDGLGGSLTRESQKRALDQYIAPFASDVGVSADEIRPYFQSQEWDSLVRFLMNR